VNITEIPGLGELTIGGAGIWTLVVGLVYAWFRFRPIMRKLQIEEDSSLRETLMKRVQTLEESMVTQRKECQEEQEKLRKEYQLEQEELHQRIREQDKIIDGLQRQIIMFQITVGQALPPDQRSDAVNVMLDNLIRMGFDGSEPKQ
jgi:hypothetical protein